MKLLRSFILQVTSVLNFVSLSTINFLTVLSIAFLKSEKSVTIFLRLSAQWIES